MWWLYWVVCFVLVEAVAGFVTGVITGKRIKKIKEITTTKRY